MQFKDLNCNYYSMHREGLFASTFEEVKSVSKENGIVCAAWYNGERAGKSVKDMNKEALEKCEKYGGVPVLRLLPPTFKKESYSLEKLEELANKGAAFRIHPQKDASPIEDWLYGDMIKVLEKTKAPLLVSVWEYEDLTLLANFKKNHPELVLILTNTNQWLNRQYIAMGAMGKVDSKSAVDWLVDFCEKRDDMFFYCWYQPYQHKELMEQIDALKNHPLFLGVKIHPREDGAHLENGTYDKFMEYVAANNIAVLCHTWDTEPMNRPVSFECYLAKYPDMKIILGHMGGTRSGCLDALRMAREYKNVYCDINGSLYSELWIEELVKMAPEHKFIFSTDQTFNDPRPVLGRVLLSKIPDSTKEKILCGNIENAIGKKLV